MKVVLVHTDLRLYWEARLNALRQYLERYDINLQVIEIAGKGSPYEFSNNPERPEWWHILFDNKIENLTNSRIKKVLDTVLDDISPDVVIAGAIAFQSGAMSVAWCLKHHRHIIIFDDSRLSDVPRGWITDFIKKSVYSGVDAMIYPAESWSDTGRHWGIDRKRIFYGIDVVDNDFWSSSEDKHQAVSRDYLLGVGRQVNRKGFDRMIKAYKNYVDAVGDKAHRLRLVGNGPEHEYLTKLTDDLGLEGLIEFIDYKGPEELRSLYQGSKAVIVPSLQENWGLVINEAMASGAIVAASRQCGAATTLINDGITGYTFDALDINDIYSALLKIHNLSEAEVAKMRISASEKISKFGIPWLCENVLNALRYISSTEKRKPDTLSRIIIKLWRGRYRQN